MSHAASSPDVKWCQRRTIPHGMCIETSFSSTESSMNYGHGAIDIFLK